MTRSLSFDRAADIYDQTRPMSGPLAERGLPAILDLAGPGGLILEVGVGTGRIGQPLVARGANLVGCDLSPRMMARLRAKVPDIRLAQADAARLPFPAQSFDVVLTVHVLHLVADWRAALREIRRVLRPGAGAYVNNWGPGRPDSPWARMRDLWHERVEAYGGTWRRPGIQSHDEFLEAVRGMGAGVDAIELGTEAHTFTPNEALDHIARRVSSDTWAVSDEILEASLRDVRGWAEQTFSDLDQPIMVDGKLLLDVIRFPS